jgi:hypothetical protein
MANLTENEKEFITFLGIEAFKQFMKWYETSKAMGVDLERLQENAELSNVTTIFDL